MISKKAVTRFSRKNGSTELAEMIGFPLEMTHKKMMAELTLETIEDLLQRHRLIEGRQFRC